MIPVPFIHTEMFIFQSKLASARPNGILMESTPAWRWESPIPSGPAALGGIPRWPTQSRTERGRWDEESFNLSGTKDMLFQQQHIESSPTLRNKVEVRHPSRLMDASELPFPSLVLPFFTPHTYNMNLDKHSTRGGFSSENIRSENQYCTPLPGIGSNQVKVCKTHRELPNPSW